MTKKEGDLGSEGTKQRGMTNGAKLGGATGAMAPLIFWSRSLKKSKSLKIKVSKSKSHSIEVGPVVSTFVWCQWALTKWAPTK